MTITVEINPACAPVSIRSGGPGSYHRATRSPGDDLSDLPADIRDQIEAHWTPAVVSAWQAERDALFNRSMTADDYKLAIVSLLDATARSRRYDSAVSISTYVGSTIPQWANEAAAFVEWRDGIWTYAYAELDKVMAGTRPQPTVEDFLAELPVIEWPPAA